MKPVIDSKSGERRGTSREYTLRRLEDAAPLLYEEVMAGRLSAHAAAVQAGIRPRRFTIVGDDPACIAAYLRRNLSGDQLAALARLLFVEEVVS